MRRRTDLYSGIGLAVLSGVLLVWVIPGHTSPPQSEGNLSPAFLPSVAAGVLLILAALLSAGTWLSKAAVSDKPHEEFGMESHGIGLHDAGDLVLWCIFAGLLMAGFLTVGFVVAGIAGLFGLMIYAGQRSIWLLGIVSILVPVAIQQIAWHAFSVQLP